MGQEQQRDSNNPQRSGTNNRCAKVLSVAGFPAYTGMYRTTTGHTLRNINMQHILNNTVRDDSMCLNSLLFHTVIHLSAQHLCSPHTSRRQLSAQHYSLLTQAGGSCLRNITPLSHMQEAAVCATLLFFSHTCRRQLSAQSLFLLFPQGERRLSAQSLPSFLRRRRSCLRRVLLSSLWSLRREDMPERQPS